MATAKDDIRHLLEELPDDATYEDIQYRIVVRQKIEKALADVEQGRVVPHEEAKRRLARWLEPYRAMVQTVSWSEEAVRDVDRIAEEIARGSPSSVATVVRWFLHVIEKKVPAADAREAGGHDHESLRGAGAGGFRLIYRVGPDELTVLAVVRGEEVPKRSAEFAPSDAEASLIGERDRTVV